MYPVLLRFGEDFYLTSYSVFFAAGYLVAYAVAAREIGRRKMDPELAPAFLLACFFGGVVGAKLLFLYQNATLAEFLADVPRYFASGFSSAGGIFGIFVALALLSKIRKISYRRLLDVVCPALVAGYGVGRIGCFLNGCDYGVACDLPWAVTFSERAVGVHPSQIYDVLSMAVLFAFLWRIRNRPAPPGWLAAVGFSILGVQRFAAELLRETTPSFIEGISQAQLACVAIVAVFGAMLLRIHFPSLGVKDRG